MHTLGHSVGDWKNQIWRGQGDSFNLSPQKQLCSLNYMYLHRFWVWRQNGLMSDVQFSLVQPSTGVWFWAGYLSLLLRLGCECSWEHQGHDSDFDIMSQWGCCKRGSGPCGRLSGRDPLWLGRWGKTGMLGTRWLWLRVLEGVGDTGDWKDFCLTKQELSRITPGSPLWDSDCVPGPYWFLGLRNRACDMMIAQAHTAQDGAFE